LFRKFLVLPGLFFALLFCGAAVAGETVPPPSSPWYAAGHLGIVTTSDLVDDSGLFISGGVQHPYQDLLTTHTGFGISAALGRRLPYNLRLEAELGYRRNGLDQLIDRSDFLGIDRRATNPGTISSVAYMVNLWYDFNLTERWKPYLGFGLGAATRFIDCGTIDCNLSNSLTETSSDYTDFAFQFGLGVAYAINDDTEITLDYRGFGMRSIIDIFVLGGSFDYLTQNVNIGIRRSF
jgi:opacity protein-like surface antigen